MTTVVTRVVSWKKAWRIIPTHYPEKKLFDRVAASRDVGAITELDMWTNSRVRQEKQEIQVLRSGDFFPKIKGRKNVVAAFSDLARGRFGNGTFGVFYTANTLATTVAETVFHRTEFMRSTHQKPMRLQMRVLIASLQGKLHDIRGFKRRRPELYQTSSYTASQAFAVQLWTAGSQGIVYDSVRCLKGECAAVFSPQIIGDCRDERCLEYEWNGEAIRNVYELKEFIHPHRFRF